MLKFKETQKIANISLNNTVALFQYLERKDIFIFFVSYSFDFLFDDKNVLIMNSANNLVVYYILINSQINNS